MFFVYHGNDVTKVRTEALKKAMSVGENDVLIITEETASEPLLREALGAHSIFRDHETYVIDTLSQNSEAFETLKKLLTAMRESNNTFIVIEEKLGVKDERLFKEGAEEILSFMLAAKKEFNIFSLTDALSNRDKKSLWILLIEAWESGKTSEEIIGTLLWQLKSMRLALVTKRSEEAGLKPFVYDKAKRALKKFKEDEVGTLAHRLIMLYHDGHSGRRDMNHALEAWVLKL